MLDPHVTKPADQKQEDVTKSRFLLLLEEIDPSRNLAQADYKDFFKRLVSDVRIALEASSTCLLVLINTIKNSKTQGYKRDVLLKVLNVVVAKERKYLIHLLSSLSTSTDTCHHWKEIANSLVSLPDLFANCDPKKTLIPEFHQDTFYQHLIATLYDSIDCSTSINESQDWLFVQVLGRTALLGHSNLVWKVFTARMIEEENDDLKKTICRILTLPLRMNSNNVIKSQFDLFIEPLYVPIFHHITPRKDSGSLIFSILRDYIGTNESLKYLICNKLLLQSCYKLDRKLQYRILFNIFAYLVALDSNHGWKYSDTITPSDRDIGTTNESLGTCKHRVDGRQQKDKKTTQDVPLFLETFLELAKSWSIRTKILFRSHEHNRYISCAIIIAMRYLSTFKKATCLASNRDEQSIRNIEELRRQVERLETTLMQGFPNYLNRSSANERQLAICVGEVVLERLHAIVIDLNQEGTSMANSSDDKKGDKSSAAPKLEFGIELDADGRDMKQLYDIDLECLFSSGQLQQPVSQDRSALTEPMAEPGDLALAMDSKSDHIDERQDDDHHHDDLFCPDDASSNVPLYLRDCMNGLAENNNPRYVRLCLAKAGELIEKLLSSAMDSSSSSSSLVASSSSKMMRMRMVNTLSDSFCNSNSDNHRLLLSKQGCQNDDAIRDIALEFAQILLHLDDQFSLEGFDEKRMKLMSLLCTAAPDLAFKYLIDEYNGDNVSIRHRLDILQAIVRASEQLSGYMAASAVCDGSKTNKIASSSSPGARQAPFGGRNRYVEYASLCFYGLVHRLKADLSASLRLGSPSAIISMTQTNHRDEDYDNSYLLSRILLSLSMILRCVNQQPIACKLSRDLLDILAAFKSHPDVGVRQSIGACLLAIDSCTPRVYLEEQLSSKMKQMSVDW